ncbi:MAG TPA: BNR-4 repeat-containing protein, partial [Thermoplasmata archaeon]|nr:BNR-4 repeat-containing protein [Thermoplasmata archaeon]
MRALVFVLVLSVAIPVLIVPSTNVSALTTVAYTTTADFDSGTKSDSSGDHFLDNGVDSPFYGFTNIPQAAFNGGRTYIAYQGAISFMPYVTYYDHAANTWANQVPASTTNPLDADGHGGPAILVQSTGRIHIFYGAHDSEIQYRRSRAVSDITSWEQMTAFSGTNTYPHAWETSNNTMYLLYRCGGLSGGDWCWRFSTDTGATWSTEAVKIDLGGAATPYVGQSKLVSGKYVFAYVKHNDDGDQKRKNVYSCRIDMATGNIESFGGTNLGIVLDDTESTASCRIEDTGADETWYAALDVDASGNPYVIYSRGIGTSVNQRFSYWTGVAWSAPTNIVATDELASYSALIATSATNVEAFLTTAGGATAYNGDLERWTYTGTWTRAEVLQTEAANGWAVSFPFVPVNYDLELKVVFAEW